MKLPKITRLPSGSYRAQVQINGRRVSVTADSRKEVERNILSLKLEERLKPQNTLSECIDKYIASKSNILSPSTIRGYESIKRNRFQSVMGMSISDITDWQAVLNDEAKSVSPKTLHNAWGLVYAVLRKYRIEPGDITLPPVVFEERKFLQPDEIKIFIKAIEGHEYEIAFLACLHGLRASEMLALDKCDVGKEIRVNKAVVPDKNHKRILKKMTKNESSTRSVPVFIPRLTELAGVAPDGRLVNTTAELLNTRLKTICMENKLTVVTLHELRHSAVSLMHFLHISEQQCMQFCGYSDIQTMRKIYTHLAKKERDNAVKQISKFMAS